MFGPFSQSDARASRFGSLAVGRRAVRISVVLVAVAVTFATGTASAFAYGSPLPCSTSDSSPVFSRWLDPFQYVQASNGGFEQGSTNWQLSSGATVAPGNEPYQVGGAGDSKSLVLAPGASAESRTQCLTMGEPTVRLFVKTPRVAGAVLLIDATVTNPTTGLSIDTPYVVIGGLTPAGWAPTLPILIGNVVGGIAPENLTLRFQALGVPAPWAIDDVYIDPFKSF